MLTIDRVIDLKVVIKWNFVFREAGLNSNTMRSAMHNRRELRREEVASLLRVLTGYGLVLRPPPEPSLFSDTNTEADT